MQEISSSFRCPIPKPQKVLDNRGSMGTSCYRFKFCILWLLGVGLDVDMGTNGWRTLAWNPSVSIA
jgi:hypothetical protein